MNLEFDNVLHFAVDWHDKGMGAAVATVIDTWGSAPRRVGSQLVVSGAGQMEGSVSGGCVEGAVVLEALASIKDGQTKVLEYGVSDDDAFAVGLACGGKMRVLVEPIGKQLPIELLKELVDAITKDRSVIYEINIKTLQRRLVYNEYEDRIRRDRSGFTEDELTFLKKQIDHLSRQDFDIDSLITWLIQDIEKEVDGPKEIIVLLKKIKSECGSSFEELGGS